MLNEWPYSAGSHDSSKRNVILHKYGVSYVMLEVQRYFNKDVMSAKKVARTFLRDMNGNR